MARHGEQTAAAVRGLLDLIGRVEERFAADERLDEPSVLEAYRWMFSILQVGTDVWLWGDPHRPRFVDIVGPYRKWGGDNADAFYQFAPVDPTRTYVVRGEVGDAVYFSLTVYGGPNDGHYTNRIVGTVNDRDVEVVDGRFEISFHRNRTRARGSGSSPTRCTRSPGTTSPIRRPGAACSGRSSASTVRARRPPTTLSSPAGSGAVTTWLEEQAAMVPIVLDDPNTVAEPYPVPATTFGWAAGDAAYAMGSFELAPGQRLVIRGRSPECAFWNVCLWNPFLHTYNYDYDRVTINGGQVVYEDDGSWEIVVASDDPGHPNWVCTQGHERRPALVPVVPCRRPRRPDRRPRSCTWTSASSNASSPVRTASATAPGASRPQWRGWRRRWANWRRRSARGRPRSSGTSWRTCWRG